MQDRKSSGTPRVALRDSVQRAADGAGHLSAPWHAGKVEQTRKELPSHGGTPGCCAFLQFEMAKAKARQDDSHTPARSANAWIDTGFLRSQRSLKANCAAPSALPPPLLFPGAAPRPLPSSPLPQQDGRGGAADSLARCGCGSKFAVTLAGERRRCPGVPAGSSVSAAYRGPGGGQAKEPARHSVRKENLSTHHLRLGRGNIYLLARSICCEFGN